MIRITKLELAALGLAALALAMVGPGVRIGTAGVSTDASALAGKDAPIVLAGTKNGADHQGRHGGPPDHSNNGGNNGGPGDGTV